MAVMIVLTTSNRPVMTSQMPNKNILRLFACLMSLTPILVLLLVDPGGV